MISQNVFLVVKSGLPEYKREVWPARDWDGPHAVLYRSFDTLAGIKLMEGNRTIDYDVLIPGKVNHDPKKSN